MDLLSIARLQPRHDPGAGYGVATAARQQWHLAIRYFVLFGGPLPVAAAKFFLATTNGSCVFTIEFSTQSVNQIECAKVIN